MENGLPFPCGITQHGRVVEASSFLAAQSGCKRTPGRCPSPRAGRDLGSRLAHRTANLRQLSGIYYHRARYYHPQLRRFLNQDVLLGTITTHAGMNRFTYANGEPIDNIDPLGLRNVDVYIWSSAPTKLSVGHVMITEHDSTKVILSQFPANGLLHGRNITLPFIDTMAEEKQRPADYHFIVYVCDDAAFDNAAAIERAKMYWDWDPDYTETQCSTAAWNALEQGGVPLGVHSDRTILPGSMAEFLIQNASLMHGQVHLVPNPK